MVRSRTTKGDSTTWPSVRSRTKALEQPVISSDVCDMAAALVACPPDDFAPLRHVEGLAKALQSPRIPEPGDGVLVRVEARDPERILAREDHDPAHAHDVLRAFGVVDVPVHRRRLERQIQQARLGYRHHGSDDLADADVADLRDVRPDPVPRLQHPQRPGGPASAAPRARGAREAAPPPPAETKPWRAMSAQRRRSPSPAE